MAATTPFNGYGRVPASTGGATSGNPTLPGDMINYTWITDNAALFAFMQDKMYDIDNNYARDPRAGAPVAFSYNPARRNPAATDRYWAKNADYTYPDDNNLYLAAIDPKSGRVLVPSYHRPWLVGNHAAAANIRRASRWPCAVDPNTGIATDRRIPGRNAMGRLQMLRPRPIDNQWPVNSGMSEFRYPTMNADGSYGDVENCWKARPAAGNSIRCGWTSTCPSATGAARRTSRWSRSSSSISTAAST